MKTRLSTQPNFLAALLTLVALTVAPLSAQGMTFDEDEAPAAESPVDWMGTDDVTADSSGSAPAIEAESAAAAVGVEEDLALKPASERGMLSLIALVLLGLAAFGSLFLMKKKKSEEKQRAMMEVLESIRVGGKWQMSLVRVPGKILVLGVTDKGMQTLTEIPEEAAIESRLSMASEKMAEATQAPIPQAPAQEPASEEANPFLDRVLNLAGMREAAAASTKVANHDVERKEVLKRLEQYRQGMN